MNSRPCGERTINSEGDPEPERRASAPEDDLNVRLQDPTPVPLEAGPLLDDIGQAMKDHPNADNLPNLLNGLVGSGH
jgi:hypothetical protein